MKSLNENWFVVTLIAVIFGVLGYLLGSRTTHQSCKMHGGDNPMHMEIHKKHTMGSEGENVFIWKSDEGEELKLGEHSAVEIVVDTTAAGGEKKIRVMVKTEED